MTANHDLERRLADYYASEAPPRAPDRVLGEALTIIESTPQRRALAPAPWRFRPLNTYPKLAVAAVAIVAVTALVVTRLLPGNGIGTEPTPTPSVQPPPSPSPTPSPTFGPATTLPEDGRTLAFGRYSVAIHGSPQRVEITIGEFGWTGHGWYVNDATRSMSFWSVANVYGNACVDSSLPDPPIGTTVADVVAALDAQAGTDMESLATPMVGGHPSTQIIMHPSPGTDATCPRGLLKLWITSSRVDNYRALGTTETPNGPREVIWIVDVNGAPVVVHGVYRPSSASEADSMNELVDSIKFLP
jgi:hypothetical protein